MTRSDTLHSRLFVEAKHGKRFGGLLKLFKNTYELAKKEQKIPVVCIHPFGSTKYLLLLDQSDLEAVADEMRRNAPPNKELIDRLVQEDSIAGKCGDSFIVDAVDFVDE